MKFPRVSVILTFHNRSKMVRRAINNIIGQSFQDFELILVDDFSYEPLILDDTDFGSLSVRNIRNKTNLGANQSRLNGLKISKGKYVCFHDDDDYWMVDKLEKQYNFLEQNPEYHVVTGYAEANRKIVKFPNRPSWFSLSIYNSVDNNLTNAQDWNVWRNISRHYKIATVGQILVFFDDGIHDRISSVNNIEQYYSSYLKVALVDPPNVLIKYYHQSLASYHCREKGFRKILMGFIYFILHKYIKIRLKLEVN